MSVPRFLNREIFCSKSTNINRLESIQRFAIVGAVSLECKFGVSGACSSVSGKCIWLRVNAAVKPLRRRVSLVWVRVLSSPKAANATRALFGTHYLIRQVDGDSLSDMTVSAVEVCTCIRVNPLESGDTVYDTNYTNYTIFKHTNNE